MPIRISELQKRRIKTTATWGDLSIVMEFNPMDVTLEMAEKLQNTTAQARAMQDGTGDTDQELKLTWVTDAIVLILKGWDVYATEEDEQNNNQLPITSENMVKLLPGGLIMEMVARLLERFTFDPEAVSPSADTSGLKKLELVSTTSQEETKSSSGT